MFNLDNILIESMSNEDSVDFLAENFEYIDLLLEDTDIDDENLDYSDDYYDKDEDENYSYSSDNKFVSSYSHIDQDDDDDDYPSYDNEPYDDCRACGYDDDFAYECYGDECDDDYDDDDEEDITLLDSIEEGCDPSIDLMMGDASLVGYEFIIDDDIDDFLAAVDDIECLRNMEAEDLIIGCPAEELDPNKAITLYPCGANVSWDDFEVETY